MKRPYVGNKKVRTCFNFHLHRFVEHNEINWFMME